MRSAPQVPSDKSQYKTGGILQMSLFQVGKSSQWMLAAMCSAFVISNQLLPAVAERGRATWYDDSPSMSVHHGSCMYGYLGNRFGGPGNWHVAALNDGNSAYSGSCGRCYELRCVPGKFKDGYGNEIDRSGDCKSTEPVIVAITDTCPCVYPANAYSNKRWCCGDMPHFDLGVWAFRKMADPSKGVVMIDFKSVSCPTDFNNGLNHDVQRPSSLGHQYPWHMAGGDGGSKEDGNAKVTAFSGPTDSSSTPGSSGSSGSSSPSSPPPQSSG